MKEMLAAMTSDIGVGQRAVGAGDRGRDEAAFSRWELSTMGRGLRTQVPFSSLMILPGLRSALNAR